MLSIKVTHLRCCRALNRWTIGWLNQGDKGQDIWADNIIYEEGVTSRHKIDIVTAHDSHREDLATNRCQHDRENMLCDRRKNSRVTPQLNTHTFLTACHTTMHYRLVNLDTVKNKNTAAVMPGVWYQINWFFVLLEPFHESSAKCFQSYGGVWEENGIFHVVQYRTSSQF